MHEGHEKQRDLFFLHRRRGGYRAKQEVGRAPRDGGLCFIHHLYRQNNPLSSIALLPTHCPHVPRSLARCLSPCLSLCVAAARVSAFLRVSLHASWLFCVFFFLIFRRLSLTRIFLLRFRFFLAHRHTHAHTCPSSLYSRHENETRQRPLCEGRERTKKRQKGRERDALRRLFFLFAVSCYHRDFGCPFLFSFFSFPSFSSLFIFLPSFPSFFRVHVLLLPLSPSGQLCVLATLCVSLLLRCRSPPSLSVVYVFFFSVLWVRAVSPLPSVSLSLSPSKAHRCCAHMHLRHF